jgi:hypothetical protein
MAAGYDGSSLMASLQPTAKPVVDKSTASRASIVLAFASVYFFWGSTYTAIRIGAAEMPALLLAGTRFFIAGIILLAWCRWRGFRLLWPPATMGRLSLIGLLLLGAATSAWSTRNAPFPAAWPLWCSPSFRCMSR